MSEKMEVKEKDLKESKAELKPKSNYHQLKKKLKKFIDTVHEYYDKESEYPSNIILPYLSRVVEEIEDNENNENKNGKNILFDKEGQPYLIISSTKKKNVLIYYDNSEDGSVNDLVHEILDSLPFDIIRLCATNESKCNFYEYKMEKLKAAKQVKKTKEEKETKKTKYGEKCKYLGAFKLESGFTPEILDAAEKFLASMDTIDDSYNNCGKYDGNARYLEIARHHLLVQAAYLFAVDHLNKERQNEKGNADVDEEGNADVDEEGNADVDEEEEIIIEKEKLIPEKYVDSYEIPEFDGDVILKSENSSKSHSWRNATVRCQPSYFM